MTGRIVFQVTMGSNLSRQYNVSQIDEPTSASYSFDKHAPIFLYF